MCGRCTGTYRSKIGATKPIFHRNMTCSNIQNQLRNKERIETRRTVAGIVIGHFLDKGDHTTYTRRKDDADAVFINLGSIKSRMLNGFSSGYHSYLREAVQSL